MSCLVCPFLERELFRGLPCYTCSKGRYDGPELPSHVHHWFAWDGIFRPNKTVARAQENCPFYLAAHCAVCKKPAEVVYGRGWILCKEHDRAWKEWLDARSGKREYIRPGHRVVRKRWCEVFREFIAEMS